MKAGHRSPRIVSPLAEELAAALVEIRPDLADFPHAVRGWARTEVQAALLRSWLDDHGVVDDDGKPRDAMLRHLGSFERLAIAQRDRLGLDPRSQAALARERVEASRGAFDLEQFMREGQEALERRQQAEIEAGEVPDDAGS